jgi:hypothetical protein
MDTGTASVQPYLIGQMSYGLNDVNCVDNM